MIVTVSSDTPSRGKRLSAALRNRADGMNCKVRCGANAEEILAEVADRHRLTVDDLKGPQVARKFAWPRQEAMWHLYESGRYSLPEIGRFLGGRDHTTILKGIRSYERRLSAVLPMREAA